MMGGGGRGDRLVEEPVTAAPLDGELAGGVPVEDALFGRPGPGLAAAVEAAADPGAGSRPSGLAATGGSDPPAAHLLPAAGHDRRFVGLGRGAQVSQIPGRRTA